MAKRDVWNIAGPRDSIFFSIDAESGEQIAVNEVGRGRTGDRSEFAKIKLL